MRNTNQTKQKQLQRLRRKKNVSLTFAFQVSAIDLIEQLHPHKCIEDYSVVGRVHLQFLLNVVTWWDVKPSRP